MSKKDKNTENLFSAIGDIDERLLEEAATYKKESQKAGFFATLFGKNTANYASGSKKMAYVRAVAACLALIMFLAVKLVFLKFIRNIIEALRFFTTPHCFYSVMPYATSPFSTDTSMSKSKPSTVLFALRSFGVRVIVIVAMLFV